MSIAVVTGAGSGIGRAVALELARRGRGVACLDLVAGAAAETAEAVRALGAEARPEGVDVRDDAALSRIVESLATAHDGVDCLVACAGIESNGAAEYLPAELWDRVHGVNLRGSFLSAQAAGRTMISRGIPGSIVLVASVNGLMSAPGQVPYASSKAGVAGLARSLAVDWAPHGIRVNAVAPGVIDTPMSHGSLSDPVRRTHLLARVPMRRPGGAEEVARAVAFLCSADASYVTGAILPVDGGWLSRS